VAPPLIMGRLGPRLYKLPTNEMSQKYVRTGRMHCTHLIRVPPSKAGAQSNSIIYSSVDAGLHAVQAHRHYDLHVVLSNACSSDLDMLHV
jgi:hypothetical protein